MRGKIKKLLDYNDIQDGIKLYLLNPKIKKRGEESTNTYLQNTIYI